MKKILLSSAAIVAFAGAASADISWTGSASLGYNDDHEDGVYADADIDLSASTELNNGWTASLTYGFELEQHENETTVDADLDGDLDAQGGSFDGNLLVSLTNGTYTVSYGDQTFAAEDLWDGVSEMDEDNFSEADGEEVLKAAAALGDVDLALSAHIEESTNEVGQLSLGVAATFGNFDVSLAYQDEVDAEASQEGDFVTTDVFGLAVGTSFGGADVTFAYAASDDEDSLGLEVSYPVGDITLGAFYVSESADEDNYGVSAAYAAGAIEGKIYYKSLNDDDEYGLGGTYDLGNGLVIAAGVIDGDSLSDDDFGAYVAADYDLGGGASLLVSYADQEVGGGDDLDTVVGGYELNDGATVLLSLDF